MKMKRASIGLATVAISMTIRGFALWSMWRWFLSPLGVPAIGLVHAQGISGMASLVAAPLIGSEKGSEIIESATKAIVATAMIWGLAAIWHYWM